MGSPYRLRELAAHMLPNSPLTAKAAVAMPSSKAPAMADVRYALTMIYLLGRFGVLPRAASEYRGIELVRIRLCRVGSDALQLNPQYATGFPEDE